MKIVYLYDSLAIWGGIERVLIDKMNYFADIDGYDVYIITASQDNHELPYSLNPKIHHIDTDIRVHLRYKYKGIKRLIVAYKQDKLYSKRLSQLLDDIKPNILVSTTNQDLKALVKIKKDIPLVVESHSNFIHQDSFHNKIKKIFNNWWARKADAIVTLTEGDAKNWRRIANNVHVNSDIVHINKTGQYSNCTAKRALFVGRFERQKGINYLFDIWKRVHALHPDWHLDMFGDGNLWDYYKKLSEKLDININVNKPPSDIFKEYINSSMLLLTSIYEPFGLVIPEAMSCGIPVVAFDCPYGPADIIKDGEDGFLINSMDVNLYVKRVSELVSNYSVRKDMGNKALISAQKYTPEQIMPKWIDFFNNLVVGKRP